MPHLAGRGPRGARGHAVSCTWRTFSGHPSLSPTSSRAAVRLPPRAVGAVRGRADGHLGRGLLGICSHTHRHSGPPARPEEVAVSGPAPPRPQRPSGRVSARPLPAARPSAGGALAVPEPPWRTVSPAGFVWGEDRARWSRGLIAGGPGEAWGLEALEWSCGGQGVGAGSGWGWAVGMCGGVFLSTTPRAPWRAAPWAAHSLAEGSPTRVPPGGLLPAPQQTAGVPDPQPRSPSSGLPLPSAPSEVSLPRPPTAEEVGSAWPGAPVSFVPVTPTRFL